MTSVLVIGGTGPTGAVIVPRLVERGDTVTILHSGRHEIPLPKSVAHIHGDPRDRLSLLSCLQDREFDAAISTSGRIRHVVAILQGRVGKLVAISGLPAYPGWDVAPGDSGLPMPLREESPTAPRRASDRPGDRLTQKVIDGERLVLHAHDPGTFDTTIVRYTMVYGPYSYIPFEWYFVRRILDGRRSLVLESDGLTVPQRGYSVNLAKAVVLALDRDESGGQVFNAGDEQALAVRGIADVIADALGHEWEIVPAPAAHSPCRNPFTARQNTLFDTSKARSLLGYRDEVPVAEATARTAIWLRDHPVRAGSQEEASLGPKAFDYGAEDAAIAAWHPRNFAGAYGRQGETYAGH